MMPTWQRLIELGREVPDQYYERPEIYPHLLRLMDAFNDLSTERPGGQGLYPIPRSKMKEYLRDDHGLDGGELDRAVSILRMVDDQYVTMVNKPTNQETELKDLASANDPASVHQLMSRFKRRKRVPKTR